MSVAMTWHYVDLDGALADVGRALQWPTVEARSWGPRLRYCAPEREMSTFYDWVRPQLGNFILCGSGDFHHLSALWQRQMTESYILVSFDNHPDWDVRPPRWACGGWLNRVLENPLLEEIQVWGCGNFELKWPNRLYANHAALESGRLKVRPWAERLSAKDQLRYRVVRRENWLEYWQKQLVRWRGKTVYVTVDLDCLATGQAVTNWENGLFEAEEVAQAIRLLRAETNVVAGDLCGAYSKEEYVRWTQKFVGWVDHPSLRELPSVAERYRINQRAIETIWPALIGE